MISYAWMSYKLQAEEPKTLNGKKTYELHSFADASTSGFGQCSYVRVKDEDENVHVSLVMGKSHFPPTKFTTIPRLELTAAVVPVKVAVMVQEELNYAIQLIFCSTFETRKLKPLYA